MEMERKNITKRRNSLFIALTLLAGIASYTVILWVWGRFYGNFFGARIIGLFGGAIVSGSGLAILGFVGRRGLIWYAIVAMSILIEWDMQNAAVQIFMNGAKHAVLSAANPESWEGLPSYLKRVRFERDTVDSDTQHIPGDQLPSFAKEVYRGTFPACLGLTREMEKQNPDNIVIYWGIKVHPGILIDSSDGLGRVVPGTIIYEKRLSNKAFLIAFELDDY